MDESVLRPVERQVLKLVARGVSDAEIAWRFRRTPGYVRQVRRLALIPRTDPGERIVQTLRPLERRLLQWREQGAGYPELAARFRRHPRTLERFEALARHKMLRPQ